MRRRRLLARHYRDLGAVRFGLDAYFDVQGRRDLPVARTLGEHGLRVSLLTMGRR
jgi:hypothetical protein